MIVSLKWLRDYVDIPLSVEELVGRLTMAGLEVDAVSYLNTFLENVITVRVEAVEPHPKADRLRLCRVSDGRNVYKIVCGAPNVEEGRIAPLALPGARVANGMTIQESRIRGEHSQGMLCSEIELGIGEDASGIKLLPADTPIGVPLREALKIDDVVLDIGVTPNRGDCLSAVGIAREIAAICGQPMRYPALIVAESGPPVDTLASVAIEDPAGCPRYAARVIEGVAVGPSPAWLRERIEEVGLRSINNIVDVTNYILMELGQPLHAFDYDLLKEHRIVVRRAAEGERFTTLDNIERSLYGDTLLICDGGGPVAIAGIMGGLDSEINPGTTRVLIESAYFEPTCIRRSSKKLGLRTEASFRFERGVDPEGLIRALDRAAMLMLEVAGGRVATGRIDSYPNPIKVPTLTLRVDRTNKFIGMNLSASAMAEALSSIEMRIEEQTNDRIVVVPPAFRSDITREIDLVEEVARLIGYDRIPVTVPEANVSAAELDPHMTARLDVKNILLGAGFFEVINYSFLSQGSLEKLGLTPEDPRLHPIRIKNPLSEEQAVMRTSLIPGLLQTAAFNLDRRNENIKIFELSKVFLPKKGDPLPSEPHSFAGVMAGKRVPDLLYGGEAEVDFTDAKGVVENSLVPFFFEKLDFIADNLPPYLDPRCAASVYCGDDRLGVLGRVQHDVAESFGLKRVLYLFELDFDLAYSLRRPHPMFRSLPRFPSVSRDMALIVDENLPVQEPLNFLWSRKESFLEQVEVFDIYKNQQLGSGKKSIGYRLTYRALDRSLTDDEVNAVYSQLVAAVLEKFQAVLR
ncbi:MAG: phenylalanine--tRNA ligase subunit beta [Syntrophobacteraceae bacterium]